MLRINCPVCGLRDETEFTYGGDGSVRPPDLSNPEQAAWHDFVFLRENPAGAHLEYWHHSVGCRHWLLAERDTLTHDFGRIVLARDRIHGLPE
ncbi:MAG: sarcosine oxidase subunit delta [Rhodospirillaceae bacterium]|jgi:sarcosine oxidase subunit delta|nr:sarcosine oxidase subunit delta [Rhodospirillaceae bacterium]MBT5457061.1 sarcosine oxidase subunit delta [Rhodospirillaceae bacterium]